MKARNLAMIVLVSTSASVDAQLCPGDSKHVLSITSTSSDPTEVTTFSRTSLWHSDDHPNCAGVVKVTTHLFLEVSPTGCSASASSAIASDSEAGHEVDAERVCTVYACSNYKAKGSHYFKATGLGASHGNLVPAGECSGGGNGGQDQDPCDCVSCGCSPIIIDLGRDGFHFSGPGDGVLFPLGGPRTMYWVGWPLFADDAWLTLDRNGNGVVDGAGELFGTATRLSAGGYAAHGYEALAELDENKDRRLDLGDPAFAELRLWGDGNRNGISEPRELRSVVAAGLVSISLEYRETSVVDEWGNRFALPSDSFVSARPPLRQVVDVFPAVERVKQ